MARKGFAYGDLVRVKPPGRRAFLGRVYGEYTPPGKQRRICVSVPGRGGVAYAVRHVTLVGRGLTPGPP